MMNCKDKKNICCDIPVKKNNTDEDDDEEENKMEEHTNSSIEVSSSSGEEDDVDQQEVEKTQMKQNTTETPSSSSPSSVIKFASLVPHHRLSLFRPLTIQDVDDVLMGRMQDQASSSQAAASANLLPLPALPLDSSSTRETQQEGVDDEGVLEEEATTSLDDRMIERLALPRINLFPSTHRSTSSCFLHPTTTLTPRRCSHDHFNAAATPPMDAEKMRQRVNHLEIPHKQNFTYSCNKKRRVTLLETGPTVALPSTTSTLQEGQSVVCATPPKTPILPSITRTVDALDSQLFFGNAASHHFDPDEIMDQNEVVDQEDSTSPMDTEDSDPYVTPVQKSRHASK